METHALLQSHEARSESRTILRVSASILFKDAPPMRGKTVDISTQGISLLTPEQVASGTLCGIRFSAMIDGRLLNIEAVAKVVYSICVGTAGFRIGCQFTDMDTASRAAVSRIIDPRAR